MTGGGAEGRFARIARDLFSGSADVAALHSGGDIVRGSVYDLGWRGRSSYPRVINRLRRLLLATDYDAIMTFGMFPSATTLLARMTTTRKPKIIINEIGRPISEATTAGRLRGIIYTTIRRVLYARSDRITANSIDGLEESCRIARVPMVPSSRTHNAIDAGAIRARMVEAPAVDIPAYAFVATLCRLDFMKRTETAIAALNSLRDRSDHHLLVIGDGAARASLEGHVRKLALESRVHFTGHLANPLPLLANADSFILTSQHEGFSNTVLEAMCCETPVITSFCSSDARQMCDAGAALGFEVGDHETLARHLAALERDASLRARLVAQAWRYLEPHLLENAIPEYEQLIRTVVAQ